MINFSKSIRKFSTNMSKT